MYDDSCGTVQMMKDDSVISKDKVLVNVSTETAAADSFRAKDLGKGKV